VFLIGNTHTGPLRNFSEDKYYSLKCKALEVYKTSSLIYLYSNCWPMNCIILKKPSLRMCGSYCNNMLLVIGALKLC